jgi:hypothetical protein
MASTYVNDLRLNEMATGDASGSWGTVTNTNLELIGEAFSYGTETIGDADSTLTIADGAADAARSFYLKITSSVDLTTTRIVTLGPNTVSKVWMIENATTGSQVITIKQGSGATINVPNGQVKMLATDGAGSGGAVLDLLVDVDLTGTTTLVNLDVSGAVDIAGDLTLSAGGDGALRFTAASSVKVLDNNAAALVFEEADNAYMTFVTTDGSEAVKFDKALDINAATQIDATVTVGVDDTGYDVKFFGATAGAYMLWDESADDLILGGAAGLSVNSTALVTGVLTTTAATVFNGGFTANADSTLGTDKKVQFRDAAIYINSSVDGQLDIVADTEIQIAATTVDLNGALDVSGTALVTGVLTTTAATVSNGGGQFNGAINVGVDDTGYDVKFFGATAGAYMLWDESADDLILAGAGGLVVAGNVDFNGDLDVDGTTNLDVVDIDGAVDMASTLQVTGTANFSDRIGSTYVYPTDAGGQTSGVTNYFWKMGRMTLAGPQAAEIKLYGLAGYGQGDQIVGTNTIQLRGSNSATVLEGCFHAIGDPGIGIQEMRYVPIGSSVFDLYVKLGPYFSLSTTVVSGGAWVPEWTDTGSGSNPASSVDIPAQYALVLGSTLPMYANLTEVAFNDYSNDVDFRVESVGHSDMFNVDASGNIVAIGKTGSAGGASTEGAYFAHGASQHFHLVITNESTDATHALLYLNRQSVDNSTLVNFMHAETVEGSITVNGSTVSYNGFSGRHESSGIPVNTPVGTVVSTIDELDVYPDRTTNVDGNAIDHLKAGQTRADHAKVEVSTSEGDACVYGVVSEFDGDGKLIVTSVGIGSIRVTGACSKGDLLESNGDGTAKVQSDDIIRSKTIGKVTIGNSDTGVKLVACVMYCG